jgi:translation initiation factor 3 subunit I
VAVLIVITFAVSTCPSAKLQRPFLLQGHERPITVVQFNYDGDLLFTASKDLVPSLWRSENGERIGTFNGHKGAIWDLDCDRFSTRLLTASADATCKLWLCETGECLHTFVHRGPVRGVAWADGSKMFATISDPFVEHNAKIFVFDAPKDGSYSDSPRLEIDLPKIGNKRVNPTNIKWTAFNEALLVSFDNGTIKLYDPNNGDLIDEIIAHEKKINRLRFNRDKTLFITSSADFTAKLFDAVDLKPIKEYVTDRPVNDAVISEHKDHILLGGGQEAMSVTTTSGKVGKFETRFFHLVYEEEFGCVKGHFGPINACKCCPSLRNNMHGYCCGR